MKLEIHPREARPLLEAGDELAHRLHEFPPLRQLGYDVVDHAGGLLAWHADQLPLEPATGTVA